MRYKLARDLFDSLIEGVTYERCEDGRWYALDGDEVAPWLALFLEERKDSASYLLLEKPKRWRAQKRDYYYAITIGDYSNLVSRSRDDNDSYDQTRYELGNYFQTEKQAEAALEAVKSLLGFIQGDGKDNGQWPAVVTNARQILSDNK